MPESFNPSIRLRRIARALREWREPTGMSSGEAAAKAGWSAAKQSRLENAAQPITPVDVMTLGLVYNVAETVRDEVFNATLAAQDRAWWDAIKKGALAADILAYVELESEASKVRVFKIDLIPGLLQTSEYAAAISRAFLPRASEELLQSRVEARIQRQLRVEDGARIDVEAVITEAALRVSTGGHGVMRRQLGRLISLAELPNVDLRVIAAGAGAYPAMGTPFSILSFDSDQPDVGYVELVNKGVYLEDAEEVETYNLNFEGLHEVALSPRESLELISTIGSSLDD